MPYLSPEVVTRWSKAKKNLTDNLSKAKLLPGLGKSTIETLKKNLDGFDGGLTPKPTKTRRAADRSGTP
jgi:hypothetical protein